MVSVTIKIKRGTAAEWSAANPTLAAGEPGYETDTHIIKYGDGTTAYNSLVGIKGADSIKLDELSTPTDVTTLNATTITHGLCPKGTNTGTKFLRDDVTWTVIDIDGGSP